jgi:hypothetical protein
MSQEPTLERAIELVLSAAGAWEDFGDPNEEPRDGVREAAALLERAKPWILAAEKYAEVWDRPMHPPVPDLTREFWTKYQADSIAKGTAFWRTFLSYRAATGDRG